MSKTVTKKQSIVSYLENVKAFRDYEIKSLKNFKTMAFKFGRGALLYQVNDKLDIAEQVDNAVSLFLERGMGSIVFFI